MRSERKLYNLGLKYECMSEYSEGDGPPHCAQAKCGWNILDDLTIEHTRGGGDKDRMIYGYGGGGSKYYQSLRRRGYPKDLGLIVLCKQCNFRKPKKTSPPGNPMPSSFMLCFSLSLSGPMPDANQASLWGETA